MTGSLQVQRNTTSSKRNRTKMATQIVKRKSPIMKKVSPIMKIKEKRRSDQVLLAKRKIVAPVRPENRAL